MSFLYPVSVRFAALAVAAAALVLGAPGQALANMGGPSKPKVDCTKSANKDKPQCQKAYHEMSDDEIYNAAYWLARQGDYREALTILRFAHDPDDKRILNATGFATRKLGDVDGALVYYARALDIDPGYTRARSYLGEAYLSKGDLASAREQLAEIATRCGRTCDGFEELAQRIVAYEAARPSGG